MEKEQKMIEIICVLRQRLKFLNQNYDKWRNQKTNDSIKDSAVGGLKKNIDNNCMVYPQIPVSHGPAQYGGLPGLILELTTDNSVMLCTKVVMNPEKRIQISQPKKENLFQN